MNLGDMVGIAGVVLAVISAASSLMALILRLMLDSRFGPLQKAVDALAVELRGDIERIERDLARMEERVDHHGRELVRLDADKIGHAQAHQMLRTPTPME